MKKLLIIPFLLIVIESFGQAGILIPATPVTDIGTKTELVGLKAQNKLDWIKKMKADVETSGFIKKTMDFAEKANKYRKQVTKFIRTTKRLKTIIESQAALIAMYSKYGVTMDFDDILDNTTERQRLDIKKRYKTIISESDKDIDELESIITPGKLEMDDYERIEAINNIENRMLYRAYSMQRLTNRVKATIRVNERERNTFTLNNKLF